MPQQLTGNESSSSSLMVLNRPEDRPDALCHSMGTAWTADYLKNSGEPDADLRSNIAAEARAKIVDERLINFCCDSNTKNALQLLMTCETTHLGAFMQASESLEKSLLSIGFIPSSHGVVHQRYDDSTGKADDGEIDINGSSRRHKMHHIRAIACTTGIPSAEGNAKSNRTTLIVTANRRIGAEADVSGPC
jgi:Mn-containing catalase